MDKSVTIRRAENGYVISVSGCEKKGGEHNFMSKEFIVETLPKEIEELFDGKFKGKELSTPESRKMSFNDAMKDYTDKSKKEPDRDEEDDNESEE